VINHLLPINLAIVKLERITSSTRGGLRRQNPEIVGLGRASSAAVMIEVLQQPSISTAPRFSSYIDLLIDLL
jgi:hypothetical protein